MASSSESALLAAMASSPQWRPQESVTDMADGQGEKADGEMADGEMKETRLIEMAKEKNEKDKEMAEEKNEKDKEMAEEKNEKDKEKGEMDKDSESSDGWSDYLSRRRRWKLMNAAHSGPSHTSKKCRKGGKKTTDA